jgi:hypothetical protein
MPFGYKSYGLVSQAAPGAQHEAEQADKAQGKEFPHKSIMDLTKIKRRF